MSYQETQDYLYGLRNRGAKLGIERMRMFAEALGNPQNDFPIIHVAGTNGKGSTCAMLESVFRKAGFRTGMFTSPHLVFLGERVQCNRQCLSQEQISNYTAELKEVAESISRENDENHPTFFEFMTAMAFLHFKREAVDIGIIETGLGGRLDSTNVVDPLVSVITSVGLDHVEQLGNTLEKIAGEKAGIIKKGKPVVMGYLPKEAQGVVERVAEERGCVLYSVESKWGRTPDEMPATNLHGDFQRKNAATTSTVVELLADRFPGLSDALSSGLSEVKWGARWQEVSLPSGQSIILDSTHNAEGAIQLEKNLEGFCREHGAKPTIVVGVLGEDRARLLIDVIVKYASRIVLVKPAQPRAVDCQVLQSFIPESFTGEVHTSTVESLFGEFGQSLQDSSTLPWVATGSIYLMGEILEHLQHDGDSSLRLDSLQDHI